MGVDMACFHPLDAWQPIFCEGSRSVFFGEPHVDFPVRRFKVPCGVCVGCRIDRSKNWALRCVLEAKQYSSNSFITLTYDDAHLPYRGSLDFDALQKFFKRLRKKIGKERIRYYAVGEYGAKLSRPHFHSIIFGFDFPDRYVWSYRRGVTLFRSELLESVWPFGFSTVGEVTFESCAYVARYVQKKLYGGTKDEILEHYKGRVPESARMSRRPGIASKFFHEYSSDIYPKDFITVNGRRFKPGRYFDSLYKKEHPDEFLQVKVDRLQRALAFVDDNTPDRLEAREECAMRRVKKLIRGFEDAEI